jgi:lysozyme family protein
MPTPAALIAYSRTPIVTVDAFERHFLETFETGVCSMDTADTGNWYRGILCGSKWGVTAGALATYRPNAVITPQSIAALSEAEALQVARSLYYDQPDLDLCVWNPVTASWHDMLWGAGVVMGTKLMQRQIGVADDGDVGSLTASAYLDWLANIGLEEAARRFAAARNAYYDQIIAIRPSNAKYRNGWRRRTAGYMPGTAWWASWRLPKEL